MPSSPPTTAQRHTALLARALAHVDAHLDQPLPAPALADVAAMSRHHFHRLFQAYLGCSVGDYVTTRRLQRACALLLSGPEPVLEIALAVGYDSAQALAKAMRRELNTTPTEVRHGDTTAWQHLGRYTLPARPSSSPQPGASPMQPTRFATLPDGLMALTATARGMVNHTLERAAKQAFGELWEAVQGAGLAPQIRSCIALSPDDPQGPDDPDCRYVAGLLFGHILAEGQGACTQPDIALTGTLAWQPLSPGRYAVFTHIGPYSTLYQTWRAIYRDWLPASTEQLRDVAPLELMLNGPQDTPPEKLHTEIWIPLQG